MLYQTEAEFYICLIHCVCSRFSQNDSFFVFFYSFAIHSGETMFCYENLLNKQNQSDGISFFCITYKRTKNTVNYTRREREISFVFCCFNRGKVSVIDIKAMDLIRKNSFKRSGKKNGIEIEVPWEIRWLFFWHIVSAWNVLQKGIDDKLSIIIGFEVRFWKKVSPGDSKKEARANWENLQKS